jgi:hypothetical protein
MTSSRDDPTLDELLGDPMTQAIMNADRVDPATLKVMLRSVAREIGGRSGGRATDLVEAQSARFDRNAVGRLPRPIGGFWDTAFCCVSGSPIRSQQSGTP